MVTQSTHTASQQIPAAEAGRIIATEGRRHTLVIRFTKRTNGELRRMVCRYDGEKPIKGGLVKVWDMEKGAWRQVNLDAVHDVQVCGVSRPARQQPRKPGPKYSEEFLEAQRRIQDLF